MLENVGCIGMRGTVSHHNYKLQDTQQSVYLCRTVIMISSFMNYVASLTVSLKVKVWDIPTAFHTISHSNYSTHY